MIGVLIYAVTQQVTQQRYEWKITNCCPENAGAEWSCVNENLKIQPCTDLILCPQVVSPKPSMSCVNVNGTCVAK